MVRNHVWQQIAFGRMTQLRAMVIVPVQALLLFPQRSVTFNVMVYIHVSMQVKLIQMQEVNQSTAVVCLVVNMLMWYKTMTAQLQLVVVVKGHAIMALANLLQNMIFSGD